ncbi:hypothetical protein [Thiopseudomonas denitrificans]|uniref:hypothetical protein n=2 Tax=Thiopseudomonas denitrificans TaxID=1501432 RepID=UPI0011AF4670|nr:hypothetical protein [Thiopseudomonas denitrificans]
MLFAMAAMHAFVHVLPVGVCLGAMFLVMHALFVVAGMLFVLLLHVLVHRATLAVLFKALIVAGLHFLLLAVKGHALFGSQQVAQFGMMAVALCLHLALVCVALFQTPLLHFLVMLLLFGPVSLAFFFELLALAFIKVQCLQSALVIFLPVIAVMLIGVGSMGTGKRQDGSKGKGGQFDTHGIISCVRGPVFRLGRQYDLTGVKCSQASVKAK